MQTQTPTPSPRRQPLREDRAAKVRRFRDLYLTGRLTDDLLIPADADLTALLHDVLADDRT